MNISWLRLAVAHRMLQSALYISMAYVRPTGLLVAVQSAAVSWLGGLRIADCEPLWASAPLGLWLACLWLDALCELLRAVAGCTRVLVRCCVSVFSLMGYCL